MKPYLKFIFSKLGYNIISKKHYEGLYFKIRLPLATTYTLPLAISYLQIKSKNNQINIVQIGANDGVTDDILHSSLLQTNAKAWLFEPLPEAFVKLKKTYEKHPQVMCINKAVLADGDNFNVLHLPVGDDEAHLVGSFTENFSKNVIYCDLYKRKTRAVSVETIYVSQLKSSFQIPDIDVLQIDAEGYDCKLIHSFFDNNIFPKIINFENSHIVGSDVENLFKRLKEFNYSWLHDNFNTCAIRLHAL